MDRQLPLDRRRSLGKVAGAASDRSGRKQPLKVLKQIAILGILLAGVVILLTPSSAFAQSCALCYTQAASSGSRMIQALKSGILVLIVPPTLGSVGMIFVMHRKRNQVRRTEPEATKPIKSGRVVTHRSDKLKIALVPRLFSLWVTGIHQPPFRDNSRNRFLL